MTSAPSAVRQLPEQGLDDPPGRIVEAALDCFARFGVSKTTLDDVASAAGCSRATIYRYFSGKQALLGAVAQAEVRRAAGELDRQVRGAPDLEELVVAVLRYAGRSYTEHDVLHFVLEAEPEIVLPHLTFRGADRVLAVAAVVLAPHLARFLPADRVARAGEWLCRIALSYLLCPGDVALDDEASVRRLVRTFVLPGLRAAAGERPEDPISPEPVPGPNT